MIVKVGGSVARQISMIFEALGQAEQADAVVIPGGWIFADAVRRADKEFELHSSTSHWMAVLAMNIYGLMLEDVGRDYGFSVIEPQNFDEVHGKVILLPYLLLRNHDELPHSWDVTSDSIAVWVAAKLGEREVIKVTAAGGVYLDGDIVERIDASKLQTDVVDNFTPRLLVKYGINMFICSPQELKNYILRGRAKGTLVEGR